MRRNPQTTQIWDGWTQLHHGVFEKDGLMVIEQGPQEWIYYWEGDTSGRRGRPTVRMASSLREGKRRVQALQSFLEALEERGSQGGVSAWENPLGYRIKRIAEAPLGYRIRRVT